MLDLGFISGVAGVPKLAGDAPAGAADGIGAISAFAEFRALVDALAGSPALPPNGVPAASGGEAAAGDADLDVDAGQALTAGQARTAAGIAAPAPPPDAGSQGTTPMVAPFVVAAPPVAIDAAVTPARVDMDSAHRHSADTDTTASTPVAEDGPGAAPVSTVVPNNATAAPRLDPAVPDPAPPNHTARTPSSGVATRDEPRPAPVPVVASPAAPAATARPTPAPPTAAALKQDAAPTTGPQPQAGSVAPPPAAADVASSDTFDRGPSVPPARAANPAPQAGVTAPVSTDASSRSQDLAAVVAKLAANSTPPPASVVSAKPGGGDASPGQGSASGDQPRSDARPAPSRTSHRIDIRVPAPSTSSARPWAATVADAASAEGGVALSAPMPTGTTTQTAPVIAHTPATPSAAPFSASVASPSLAPAGTPVPEGTAHQIVQALRLQWSNGAGEAHIRLRPEHFGELSIAIRVERGQVVARLEAEAPAVREWLQANQASLRQGLADQHLTLERLDVSEPPADRSASDRRGDERHADDEAPRRRRPSNPDRGTRFEVVV